MQDGDREGWNLWEAVGALRANVQRLIEGQQRLEERIDRGLKENKDQVDRGLKENRDQLGQGLKENKERLDRVEERLDRKVDRLVYTVAGVGGTIIALLILEMVRG